MGPSDFHRRTPDVARRTPDETIETILALRRVHDYVRFGIESVQFQAVLASSLVKRGRARGVHVPVVELSQTADKVSRMQRMQPILASGGILLSRRHVVLMDQLRQFPRGAHDDGPDALEMAVRIAQRPRPVLRVLDHSTGIISEVKRQ